MEALSKRYLRRKFARHPFLWLLLHDDWLWLGLIGFFTLLVFLGLFLPRIWTTSPPGSRPVVKVSGLDLAQAWSLKRSALQAMSGGRFDDANYAWIAALANNRADAGLVRGALRCFLKSGDTRKYRKIAVPLSLWHLQLTRTNSVDLELVATVLAQYGHSDLVIDLLEPREEALTPGLEAAYLKALFHSGRSRAFSYRWSQARARLATDEELLLCHSAWVAGWGPIQSASGAVKTLQAALDDPAHRVLARRLLLTSSARRLDLEQYEKLLNQSQNWRTNTLLDHTEYWRLLARSGRKLEALRLAESLPCRPASAEEVLALAQLYREWALWDQALGAYRQFTPDFADSAELWVAYARMLIETRQWDELRRVALQIRVQADAGHDGLAAYSYYLEGRAELGLQRHFHATAAFQKIIDWEFHHPKLGLRAASDLILSGHTEIARDVLLKLEKSLVSDAEYWPVLFQAAEKLKQADLMLAAARRAYQLRPCNLANANNYAAALLILRQSPEETARLTLATVSSSPHSVSALINHAAALLLNERVDEAFALLRKIDTTNLTRRQRTLYHLDLFEACFKLERYDQARAISHRIDAQNLYPPQVRWFEETLRQLPARNQGDLTLLSSGDDG